MPQQQFLLLVLVMVAIGATIATGVFLYNDQSVAANRDALSADLTKMSVRVYQYYVRPKPCGGREDSFDGLTMDCITRQSHNANGSYSVQSVTDTEVVLRGEGVERGSDGSRLTATMTVRADTTFLTQLN